MRTQVAIIGAGPTGLVLAHLLHAAGVSSIVLEKRSRAYVEARIRAGVLEQGTVNILNSLGLEGASVRGLQHDGFAIAVDGESFRIDMRALTGGTGVTVYGQTEVTRELIAAAVQRGIPVLFEASDVKLHDVEKNEPYVTFLQAERSLSVECSFIAGCDGSHGVAARSIPCAFGEESERIFPGGWLGILADVPPCSPELVYSSHERGFALASLRSPTRSRYYIQCEMDQKLEDWSDDRIWDELELRLGPGIAKNVVRGPSIEKSIAPLRSFVRKQLRHGRLFLAGDAGHIVPPAGAKGLNLAIADAKTLADALIAFFRHGNESPFAAYSGKVLARAWQATRFSWWFTNLTHRLPASDAFSRHMQRAELDHLRKSRAAQTMLAESYTGISIH